MTYAVANRDGSVLCGSSLPWLGYPCSTLKSMEQAGYILLLDGQRIKFPTAAQHKEVLTHG